MSSTSVTTTPATAQARRSRLYAALVRWGRKGPTHSASRPSRPQNPFRYRPQLDGLRALAVLGVVAFHARGRVFPGGYVGVDVFFVLSGYLITSLLVAEHGSTRRISLRRFYARRALRLLPALVLVSATTAIMWSLLPQLADHRATMYGVVTALTYTSSPAAAGGVSHLGVMLPTWSLSVEEYFYLLWPLLLLGIVITPSTRSRRIAFAALVLAAISYRWWAAWGADWKITRISYGADTRAEQLLVGCALAVVLPTLRRTVGTYAAATAVGFLIVFVLWRGRQTGSAYLHGASTVVALSAALIIAHAVQHPDAPLVRALRARPLVWIGQRSYGIYLWHVPLIALIAAAPISAPEQLVVKLAAVFLIPALSYRYIEAPCLGLKHRLSVAAPRPAVAAESVVNVAPASAESIG